jgi:hypothetical protein
MGTVTLICGIGLLIIAAVIVTFVFATKKG